MIDVIELSKTRLRTIFWKQTILEPPWVQEELVEDEVQEYKVTTSQEPRREERDRIEEEEEEEDDEEEEEEEEEISMATAGAGGDYRSLF